MNTNIYQDEEKVFHRHNFTFLLFLTRKKSLKDLVNSILSAGWEE